MALSKRQLDTLNAMGIPVWVERSEVLPTESSVTEQTQLAHEARQKALLKNPIEKAIKQPNQSGQLSSKNTKTESAKLIPQVAASPSDQSGREKKFNPTVLLQGNKSAQWGIVIEVNHDELSASSSGLEYDVFSFPAGQLLVKMLASIGLHLDEICLVVMVLGATERAPEPSVSEMKIARELLVEKIASIDPLILLCVGRITAQALLNTNDPLSRLRNKVHTMIHPVKREKNIAIVATYNPSYLLRSPSQKRKAWEDLKRAYSEWNEQHAQET